MNVCCKVSSIFMLFCSHARDWSLVLSEWKHKSYQLWGQLREELLAKLKRSLWSRKALSCGLPRVLFSFKSNVFVLIPRLLYYRVRHTPMRRRDGSGNNNRTAGHVIWTLNLTPLRATSTQWDWGRGRKRRFVSEYVGLRERREGKQSKRGTITMEPSSIESTDEHTPLLRPPERRSERPRYKTLSLEKDPSPTFSSDGRDPWTSLIWFRSSASFQTSHKSFWATAAKFDKAQEYFLFLLDF